MRSRAQLAQQPAVEPVAQPVELKKEFAPELASALAGAARQPVNPRVSDGAVGPLVDEGDLLTVTFGKETINPIKFNTFEVGPFSLSVCVRKGESSADAHSRARLALAQIFEAELTLKLQEFAEHVMKARDVVRQAVPT